jgi:hypothetical protein
MTMKSPVHLLIALAFVGCAVAQDSEQLAPEWKATIRVVDERGGPVPEANVKVWYHIRPPSGQAIAMTNKAGVTDTNGVFITSERSKSIELVCEAQKEGYYSAGRSYELGHSYQYDPVKWSPNLRLVLKKIGQPIPMYARRTQIEVPEVDKVVGFDLVEHDWVAPYGKGKQSDFIFDAHRRCANRRDFDSDLKVSFANPGDGLVPVSVPLKHGSGLRLPALAPSDGYSPGLSRYLSNTSGGGWRVDTKEDQNYFFRVRTILDEGRNVKSAMYGKIHGDFAIDPINSKTMLIIFTYYLNPEQNSRNVEFDPRRNLFRDLRFAERPVEP